jgi:hypothetical protein
MQFKTCFDILVMVRWQSPIQYNTQILWYVNFVLLPWLWCDGNRLFNMILKYFGM